MHSQDHGVKPLTDEATARMRRGLLKPVRDAAEREPDLIAQAETEPEPEAEPERPAVADLAAMDELVREAAQAAAEDPVPRERDTDVASEPVSLSMATFREAQSDGE